MVEPGRDREAVDGPTALGFVPILAVIIVLFAAIALVVTRHGEQVIAWSVVGAAGVLLLLSLAWEALGRRRN